MIVKIRKPQLLPAVRIIRILGKGSDGITCGLREAIQTPNKIILLFYDLTV